MDEFLNELICPLIVSKRNDIIKFHNPPASIYGPRLLGSIGSSVQFSSVQFSSVQQNGMEWNRKMP